MTIYELIKKGCRSLEHTSQTPQLDCEILLSFVLGKDKVYLLVHGDEEISKSDSDNFAKLIDLRSKGTPIAYLTNIKEFYSLPFYVDKNVLIPRPETERLVDLAFNEIKRRIELDKNLKRLIIYDVGTGSGCIAISLIHKIQTDKLDQKIKFIFFLTDISGKALKVAKKNFKSIIKSCKNIDVNFIKADLLGNFKDKYDIIVSNPPYIPSEQIKCLDHTVRDFEPKAALDGGEEGIKIIEKLITQSVNRLSKEGVLLFEMHEKHPDLIKLFLKQSFPDRNVEFKKDCFKMWRFAVVSR